MMRRTVTIIGAALFFTAATIVTQIVGLVLGRLVRSMKMLHSPHLALPPAKLSPDDDWVEIGAVMVNG